MEFLSKRVKATEIEIGDLILSCDTLKKKDVYRRVLNVMHPIVKTVDQVRILAKAKSLTTSNTHPTAIFEEDNTITYVPGGNIKIGNYLVGEGITKEKVISTILPNISEKYIDFSIDKTENYYAGDTPEGLLLAHNSATFNYPVWHLEFATLIELKNNKGTPETRLPVVDYCIHLNRTMYERLLEKGNITFFSPDEVPDLYDAFYGPAEEFKVLYEKYENDPKKTKKVLPAVEVFTKIVTERFGTGRIYPFNADLVNTHSSLHEKIYMTNLCVEITQHTKPMGSEESLIALCTLSAVNWGKVQNEAQMVEACDMAVRGLDELLGYQDYPNEAARRHTMRYRPLGVGIIGLAHDMVKNGQSWSNPESWNWVEDKMESMAYWLTKTSIDLAEERGACPQRTKYHDGIFPMDSATGGVTPKYDWSVSKARAKQHGIRNSTLIALMPSETSSQLANETNGIQPPRSLITTKGNKDSAASQVVPEFSKYNHAYELEWDVPVSDYIELVARLQKYTDQAISVNESYDPNKGEITISKLLQHMLLAYKRGIKTMYYCNTNTDTEEKVDDSCESGACKL